jgi:hypothetical protein
MLRENAQVESIYKAEISKNSRQSDCSIVVKRLRNGRRAKGTGYTVENNIPTYKKDEDII